MRLSASRLRRWRRLALVRERDERTGRPVCQVCNQPFELSQIQVHHIYPKGLFPRVAYSLKNAAVCCTAHHQGMVHRYNAALDLHDGKGWKHWRQFFRIQNSTAHRRRFNETNQPRV